ncbi:hypothetical protein Esti_005360 [Eimeria stiedai]
MTNKTPARALLPSSLTAGFPALPPACLYILQTTHEEVSRLRDLAAGSTTPDHSWGAAGAAPLLAGGGASGSPTSPAVTEGRAASHSAQPSLTHACVVFSRWTPYKSLPEVGGQSKPAEAVKTAHASLLGARTKRLPGRLEASKKYALQELKQYEAQLRGCGKQQRVAAVMGAGEPETQQPLTSLGVIMREVDALDPAEFLLLHSRMQQQLKAASLAAAAPLLAPLPPHCRSSKGSSSSSDEMDLSERMGLLAVGSSGEAEGSCRACPYGDSSSSNSSSSKKSTSSSSSSSGCGLSSPSRQPDGRSAPPTDYYCPRDSTASPAAATTSSRSSSSREKLGEKETRGAWRACGEAAASYDAVGNEVGARYYLRDSLSQQYWDGLLLDSDSWFEMTVERIAAHMAATLHAHSALQRALEEACLVSPSYPHTSSSSSSDGGTSFSAASGVGVVEKEGPRVERVIKGERRTRRPLVAVDGCCGAGGDVRQLSRHFDLVLGVDANLLRVALCRHNCQLLAELHHCAPVVMLNQQLQQLAAFRGCWSLRRPHALQLLLERLSLAALLKQQEAINEAAFGCAIKTQEQQMVEEEKTIDASAATRFLHLERQAAAAGETTVGRKGGEEEEEEGALPLLSHCPLCVPFSSFLCPFCAAEGHQSDSGRESSAAARSMGGEGAPFPSQSADEGTPSSYSPSAFAAVRETRRPGAPITVNPSALLPIDWLYMSPPWGGVNYEGCRNFLSMRYSLSMHDKLVELVCSAAKVAPNVCLFLPRSTDLHELFVLAALMRFPLVEVEVLYLPSRKKTEDEGGGSHSSKGEACCLAYPKAVLVYLVREVRAWVESRGLPEGSLHARASRGCCKGWSSSQKGGFKQPMKDSNSGLNFSFRANHQLDFAFCPLSGFNNKQVEGAVLQQQQQQQPPTADLLLLQQGEPSSSCPLSSSKFMHAVEAAMVSLVSADTPEGRTRLPAFDLIEAAFQQGSLEAAIAAFSSSCGPAVETSLRRLSQQEATLRRPNP